MRGSKSIEKMREALVNLLSKGGQQFRQFDDAYAEAFRNRVMIPDGDPRAGRPLGVAQNMLGAFGGSPITHGPGTYRTPQGGERMPQGIKENILSYGIPATGATVRYVLPAAGVSLAGRGLMDLIGGTEDDNDQIMITIAPPTR
jgi:hypothetical protein